ncbi:hypothetical protein D3C86_1525140 [compost metagenome]
MRRHAGAIGLYRWMVAWRAPRTDSTVRRIRSSRDWVSTTMFTSAGIRSSSISMRTKSKSVCEADGKATSISFSPTFTSCSKKRSLRAGFIGSIRAWLPSRRSVLIQRGARVIWRDGQVRSGRLTVVAGRYLAAGLRNMGVLLPRGKMRQAKIKKSGKKRKNGGDRRLPNCHGALGPATGR